jgi:hypothetical protein
MLLGNEEELAEHFVPQNSFIAAGRGMCKIIPGGINSTYACS